MKSIKIAMIFGVIAAVLAVAPTAALAVKYGSMPSYGYSSLIIPLTKPYSNLYPSYSYPSYSYSYGSNNYNYGSYGYVR